MSYLQNVLGHTKDIMPDERTYQWPLMDPKVAVALCTAYVITVLVGKEIMKNFEKFELKYLRILHNGLLTACNFYFVVELVHQASLTCWYGPIFRGQDGLGMAKVLYLYYLSKYWEFLDTFIMVLRKSNSQISFLHVYHHVSVTMVWWFNNYYYPGGEGWPAAALNSFVHVWMYGYYFLATLNIEVTWKKYLTQLQIIQLGLFMVLGVLVFVRGSIEFRFIGVINGIYAFSVLILFLNFYIKSYLDNQSKKREERSKNSGKTNTKEKKSN